MSQTAIETLIDVGDCSKAFPLPDGKGEHTVLPASTCGSTGVKSLRCSDAAAAARARSCASWPGLIPASTGRIVSNGVPLTGPNADVGMVFQSFALLPWLTVIENVELGLEARNVGTDRTDEARAARRSTSSGSTGLRAPTPESFPAG